VQIFVRHPAKGHVEIEFPSALTSATMAMKTWVALAGARLMGSAIAVRSLHRRHQAMGQRTIVMSNIEDIELIRQALEQGVRGYIPVSLPHEVAIEAIRLVEAGGVYVPASSLMAPSAGLHGHFTARQAAVVDALCKGKANKRIAHELNMCESTVKVHLRNIMKKLCAKNRTEVALIVNGLLEERGGRRGAT
jgi:DNA-binding NarL/FixJ family response regulator